MAPITATTEVDRPAEEVFGYATDPTRFHEWQQGVVDGHVDPPGPPTVGTLFRTTRRIGGTNRATTVTVSHIDPPRAWGLRSVAGPVRAIVDGTVEPITAERSRLTIAVDFTGHGMGVLLVPLAARQAARDIPANLAALKQRLES